jgi:hypothetical protein
MSLDGIRDKALCDFMGITSQHQRSSHLTVVHAHANMHLTKDTWRKIQPPTSHKNKHNNRHMTPLQLLPKRVFYRDERVPTQQLGTG